MNCKYTIQLFIYITLWHLCVVPSFQMVLFFLKDKLELELELEPNDQLFLMAFKMFLQGLRDFLGDHFVIIIAVLM